MKNHAVSGLIFAGKNALRTIWGGAVTVSMLFAFTAIGPGIESKFFPVITDYELQNIRRIQGGGFSFRPDFIKERDCTYYGVTWFAVDEKGDISRIQLGRQYEPGPPETGPVGRRAGERVTLYPPEGTRSVFGINHHQCSSLWQTRTTVGPFMLVEGRPDAKASPVHYAFWRKR